MRERRGTLERMAAATWARIWATPGPMDRLEEGHNKRQRGSRGKESEATGRKRRNTKHRAHPPDPHHPRGERPGGRTTERRDRQRERAGVSRGTPSAASDVQLTATTSHSLGQTSVTPNGDES